MYVDLFSPSLAFGELAHNADDPVHFSSDYFWMHAVITQFFIVSVMCNKFWKFFLLIFDFDFDFDVVHVLWWEISVHYSNLLIFFILFFYFFYFSFFLFIYFLFFSIFFHFFILSRLLQTASNIMTVVYRME